MKRFIIALSIMMSFLYAKIDTVVSITPIKEIVKAIGGDRVEVSVMVPPGESPHTYEPKPSQMKAISKANIYFAVGVEFEDIWLKKFHSINPDMKIVHLEKGIKRYPLNSHHHEHSELDPHIWTAPKNLKIMAKEIEEALESIDRAGSSRYRKALQEYIKHINKLQKEIKSILSRSNTKTFMVFHPSWGYFAKEFGLKMVSIETEGKEPSLKEMTNIIKEAKKNHISVIITQPEFSDKKAQILSREIGAKIIKISPLSQNLESSILEIAKAISGDDSVK